MNKTKLTIVYYENPAAIHNIKIWEKSVIQQIIYMGKLYDDMLVYILDKRECKRKYSYEKELVVCIPTWALKENNTHIITRLGDVREAIKKSSNYCELGEIEYMKTLIFGEIDIENINELIYELKYNINDYIRILNLKS